jgi:orotate phosphoribosyltransferase
MKDALELIKETGALLEGHFLLTSGRHSNKYMQCAKIFQYSDHSEELCKRLADKFKDENIDIVIGPALGAVIMSYEVSKWLKVKNLFAERENGTMTLRRGFAIDEGARVLVVEDVITTGGSVKEVINVVKEFGGNVIGVGCLVDRTGGNIDFGVKFASVISMKIESYTADECPLCKQDIPFVKPGSRALKK